MTFRFENTRPDIGNEEILADLRRVAAALQLPTLSHRSYQDHGRFSSSVVKKRFGTWNAAIIAAGLEIGSRRDLADEELFDNLRKVWISLGRQPRKGEMAPPLSTLTHNPYVRRFGGWLAAMHAFVDAHSTEQTAPAADPVPTTAANARQPSLRLRFSVMRRDRFTCTMCGRSPATHASTILHLDHNVPFSRGGRTDYQNLRTVCADCNLGKADLDP